MQKRTRPFAWQRFFQSVGAMLCIGLLSPAAYGLRAKTKEPQWPALSWKCPERLNQLTDEIQKLETLLEQKANTLPWKERRALFMSNQPLAHQVRLFAPRVFWRDIFISRQSQECSGLYSQLKSQFNRGDRTKALGSLGKWASCHRSFTGVDSSEIKKLQLCTKGDSQQHAKKTKRF